MKKKKKKDEKKKKKKDEKKKKKDECWRLGLPARFKVSICISPKGEAN